MIFAYIIFGLIGKAGNPFLVCQFGLYSIYLIITIIYEKYYNNAEKIQYEMKEQDEYIYENFNENTRAFESNI